MASEGAAPPPPPPPVVYRRARSSSSRKRARSFQDTDPSSASSSVADQDGLSRLRGKRARKTKIHFDDYYSEKPVKRVRRIRIMRYLGLIAPVGSPFSLSQVRSDVL